MPTLHIANTQFEWELTHHCQLQSFFNGHPFHVQLQFLPFLYASAEDYVLLFHKPDQKYFDDLAKIRPNHPKPLYFDKANFDVITTVESWGASRAIGAWAKKNQLEYPIPDLSIVKQISAKSFTFSHVPNLPNAIALQSEKELYAWLSLDFWPKVLKANYGTAGRGLRIIQCKTALHLDELTKFCQCQWENGDAVIGEPWLDRQKDFSTQWLIKDGVEYLGSTLMECNAFGTYKGSTLTNTSFADEHEPLLKKVQQLGFYGHLGIDGFTHKDGLHITEINPRKTMGWVAIQLAKRVKLENLSIRFVKPQKASHPLLPFQVEGLPPFKMQLDLDFMNA